MSLDAALAAVVADAVAPLIAEIRALRVAQEAHHAASPSQLATVAELVRLGYGSPATVRRRIADGTYPCVRHGRSVRVDLASLRPIDRATVSALAAEARR